MAKKQNLKNSTSNNTKNSSKNKTSNTSQAGSMKDTHAQVPDNSPSRSGPGGE